MFLTVFAFLSILAFIVFTASKAYRFAHMPLHGRLELYPVPKEKGRSEYGGSYYEEMEWWKKPRQISTATEVKEMLKEMLFIKKLFDNQKPLWWISYALHLGIYFIIGWTILLLIGAIAQLNGLSVGIITLLTSIVGVIGLFLAAIGSGALFLRRVFDTTLSRYTTPQEYFNLLLLFAVTVTGILVWSSDFTFHYAQSIMGNVLTFTPLQVSGLLSLHIVLLGIMFIYIPLSKMSHYVGKYFTFHKVLWENDPNIAGSEVEKKLINASGYTPKVKWSAPHITQPPVNSNTK